MCTTFHYLHPSRKMIVPFYGTDFVSFVFFCFKFFSFFVYLKTFAFWLIGSVAPPFPFDSRFHVFDSRPSVYDIRNFRPTTFPLVLHTRLHAFDVRRFAYGSLYFPMLPLPLYVPIGRRILSFFGGFLGRISENWENIFFIDAILCLSFHSSTPVKVLDVFKESSHMQSENNNLFFPIGNPNNGH